MLTNVEKVRRMNISTIQEMYLIRFDYIFV